MADIDVSDETEAGAAQSSSVSLHPAIIAADNHNIMAGDKSITADDVVDWFSKGTRASVASGAISILNTGIDVANFFGGGLERIDTLNVLKDYDDDLGKYYKDHKEGADIAGFLALSLAPGMTGIKGMQMLKAASAEGMFGKNMGMLLGFETRSKQYLKLAASEIAAGEGSLFGTINRNKLLAIANGYGDQALQAAAFEVMVAATMKASPILDKDSWSDMGWNIGKGALIGGLLGGTWEGLVLSRKLNKDIVAIDAYNNLFRAVTVFDKTKAATGDVITKMLESLDDLAIPISKDLDATQHIQEEAIKTKAINKQWLRVNELATKAAGGDAELGNALTGALRRVWEVRTNAEATGGLNEAFSHQWNDVLQLAKTFSRIDEEAMIEPTKVFYSGEGLKADSPQIFTTTKPKTGSQAYAITGNPAEVKIGYAGNTQIQGSPKRFYASLKEAFDDGMDVYMNQQGRASVNSRSKIISELKNPTGTNDLIWNVREGTFSQTAVPTVGDLAESRDAIKLVKFAEGIQVGDQLFRMEGKSTKIGEQSVRIPFKYWDMTPLEANARYVYADMLTGEKNWKGMLRKPVVDQDIPMLEAVLNKMQSLKDPKDLNYIKENLKLRTVGSNEINDLNPEYLQDYIVNRKKEAVQLLMNQGKDIREIAQIVNARRDWIESGMQKTEGAFIPSEELYYPKHVKISYDTTDPILLDKTGKNVMQFPGAAWVAKGMENLQTRIQLATESAKNIATAIQGPLVDQFPELSSAVVKAKANSLGAGSSFWGSANADYDSLAQIAETIGKGTKLLVDRLTKNTLDALATVDYAVRNDAKAGAQLGVITALLRRSEKKFYFHPDGSDKIISQDLKDWLQQGKSEEDFAAPFGWSLARNANAPLTDFRQQYVIHELDSKVASYLRTHVERNDIRIKYTNAARTAWGMHSRYESGSIYVPPIDTRKYPFIAIVKEREGMGGTLGDTSVITANSEEQLTRLMGEVPKEKFDVYTKQDVNEYKKALGEYEYSLSLHENQADSELKKRGILGAFFPRTDAASVLDEYTNWHTKMEIKLARTSAELQYGQQIAEIRALGEQYSNVAASKLQGATQSALARVANPFEDYIKTMLNVSKKQEEPYRLWRDLNEFAEQGFTKAFNVATDAFHRANKGQISWEQANEEARKFGLGAPFQSAATQLLANVAAPKPVLTRLVSQMNAALAAVTLRLDFINPLINIISTPILLGAELSSLKANIKDPAIVGQLSELLTTRVPGREDTLISPTKLMAAAIKNYFSDESPELIARYKQSGWIRDFAQQHHDMIDQSAQIGVFARDGNIVKLRGAADRMTELGSKLTGNNFAEEFTRFVAADVMRQITETAGLSAKEANGYITTFVNRVQGNYIAAQRPILFQGALGQALGLFQTYQFNLLQQAFRYVGNGDAKTLAIFAGLQSSLYGLQGLPAFNFLNTQIIGNAEGNTQHKDFYTGTRSIFGKDIGDFILHGLASNALTLPVGIYNEITGNKVQAPNLALYSRGDINPRTITVIPNPLHPEELPAVSATIKVVSNLLDAAGKIAAGGRVKEIVTQGLEHNGVSRPLTGVAQVIQGYSTTSKGGLIAGQINQPTVDNFGYSNDMWLISSLGRIAGAKPLQEALAMDALYRSNAYKAKDLARIAQLGEAVKTAFVENKSPTEGEVNKFATEYAAAGGHMESFSRFLLQSSKHANTAAVNEMMRHLRNPTAVGMMQVMGGTQLPDFTGYTGQ